MARSGTWILLGSLTATPAAAQEVGSFSELAVALLTWTAPVGAQDDLRAEVFFGGGGFIADEGIATFDVGATAWLAERWGLGVWATFPGGGGVLFAPALRYQSRLRRRGHFLHLGAGPGYADGNSGVAGAAEWVFFPYADIMYGIQAAGNRRFGLRTGARLVGHGLHLVAVFSFTTD